jgi:hypothetical protein
MPPDICLVYLCFLASFNMLVLVSDWVFTYMLLFIQFAVCFCLIFPVHQKPVIATLTRLSNEKSKLGGSRANPANKRKIEVNSRKSGASFAKLNSGDLASRARQGINQKSMLLLPPSRMSKQPLRLRTARKKLEFFDMKAGGITGMAFF